MTELGPGYTPSPEAPDNMKSIVRKARNPTDVSPYDGKDKSRGKAAKIPQRVWRFFRRVFLDDKVLCENFAAPRFAGRKYRQCPVPYKRRIIHTRPWYCQYCRLKNDPDPK